MKTFFVTFVVFFVGSLSFAKETTTASPKSELLQNDVAINSQSLASQGIFSDQKFDETLTDFFGYVSPFFDRNDKSCRFFQVKLEPEAEKILRRKALVGENPGQTLARLYMEFLKEKSQDHNKRRNDYRMDMREFHSRFYRQSSSKLRKFFDDEQMSFIDIRGISVRPRRGKFPQWLEEDQEKTIYITLRLDDFVTIGQYSRFFQDIKEFEIDLEILRLVFPTIPYTEAQELMSVSEFANFPGEHERCQRP